MRLLNTRTLALEAFMGPPPPYAILSHTWGDGEKYGAAKVIGSAKKAHKSGFKYLWIDSCCIDKNSSAELSEAINSMFNWYKDSTICYAYLSDMHSPGGRAEPSVAFEQSRWFTRGWTEDGTLTTYMQLQELLAPREIEFFDATWDSIGTRTSLAQVISTITRIDASLLEAGLTNFPCEGFSIHTRMTWAYQRETTRLEDMAYSLMGIFGVNMPLLYGEGQSKAFKRLQGEIINKSSDQSILLHRSGRSLLAKHLTEFLPSDAFQHSPKSLLYVCESADSGIQTSLLLYPLGPDADEEFLGIVECVLANDPSKLYRPALRLSKTRNKDEFIRMLGWHLIKPSPTLNQVEVVNKVDGSVVTIIEQHKLQRQVVKLRQSYAGPGEMYPFWGSRVYLHSIVHKTSLQLFEYAKCHCDAPLPVRFMQPERVPGTEDLFIMAAISLVPHSGDKGSFLVILIFGQFSRGLHSQSFPDRIFPYLVSLRDWLSPEKSSQFNPLDLKFVQRHLWGLPIYKTNSPFDYSKIESILLRDAPKQDSTSRFFMSTPDGVQIAVSLDWKRFLEDDVLYFEAEISEGTSNKPKGRPRGRRRNASPLPPEPKRRKLPS
ncbi:HET-domain-containing protein [Nemania sp. FL0031]|nr:HET-domain-containing protein [Nemania sp. FL0031]